MWSIYNVAVTQKEKLGQATARESELCFKPAYENMWEIVCAVTVHMHENYTSSCLLCVNSFSFPSEDSLASLSKARLFLRSCQI